MKLSRPTLFRFSFCFLTLFALAACPADDERWLHLYPDHEYDHKYGHNWETKESFTVDTPDTCDDVECGVGHTCVVQTYKSAASGQIDERPACIPNHEAEAQND